MNVALYARVSTTRQEQDETIASQLLSLQNHASDKGYQVNDAHVYLDDGYSGSTLERLGLDRLRDSVQAGLIDLVLIYSPDRLARDYVSQQVAIAELKRHGCAVEFVNGPASDKPEDRLLLQMQGMFAEYERTLILERTRRGRLHKAQQGLLVPSQAPYGYRRIPAHNQQPAYLEVYEPEAKIVRQMYHWMLVEGLSNRQIAKRLREQGIKAPTRELWHPHSIRAILLNPIYGGTAYYNKRVSVEPKNPQSTEHYRRQAKCSRHHRPREEWIPIPVPAIVAPTLHEEAAEQMRHNKLDCPRNTHFNYLLRNIVRCGYCGLRMGVRNQPATRDGNKVTSRYAYYRCPARDPLATTQSEKCPARFVRAQWLDEAVWTQVRELLLDRNRLAEQLGQLQGEATVEDSVLQQQLERLQRLQKQNVRQQERLLDAYQQGVIELEELTVRRDHLARQGKQLDTQIAQTEHERENQQRLVPALQAIEQFRIRVAAGLDVAETDFDKRRQIVKLLVEDVIVTEGDVEIRYVVPLSGICNLRQPHHSRITQKGTNQCP